MGIDLPVHRLIAFNTATESDNKIHDDEVAAKLGFAGGLVPGVDVYAYLCHPLIETWGPEFFERGCTDVTFGSPIYDGEEVEIRARRGEDGSISVEASTNRGVRARLEAHLTEDIGKPAPPARAPLPASRPPATPDSLAPGTVLGTFTTRCSAAEATRYLDDIRDSESPVADWRAVHPGWVLRRANEALTRSVVLPPWIHVGSVSRYHRALGVEEEVTVTAEVRENFDRKGHLFVRADVLLSGNDGSPVCSIDHTAIYQTRQLR
ncbi:MAG: hypothetical protein O3C27_01390 [Actinomycetota bacterium]|nr:hypothetical protein [Actinomycetota bacterium]